MASHPVKSRFDKLKAIASKPSVSKSDTERMNKIAGGNVAVKQAEALVKG